MNSSLAASAGAGAATDAAAASVAAILRGRPRPRRSRSDRRLDDPGITGGRDYDRGGMLYVRDPSEAPIRVPRLLKPRLAILATAAVVASACAAAGAQAAAAAALSVPVACVVDTQSSGGSAMPVIGAGFTPGDSIELTTDKGDGFGTATVGAGGSFATTMAAPVLSKLGPDAEMFTLTAADQTDGVTTATATFAAANLAVATTPARARPGRKVTFSFSGFVEGKGIYAHYMHRGKLTATKRFGKATGPCGVLKARAALYPGVQRYDSYKVQFDDARKFSASALPRYVTTLNIFRF
jgi:hypothetical protein